MIKDQGGPITVPPGSIIIFPQQIVHSVKAGVQPDEESVRLFLGHRLTYSDKSLFEDILKVTKEQGLPRIPSGQFPHMYTPSHIIFHVEKIIRPWTDPKKGVFKEKILEKKILNSSNPKKDGTGIRGNTFLNNEIIPFILGLPIRRFSRSRKTKEIGRLSPVKKE